MAIGSRFQENITRTLVAVSGETMKAAHKKALPALRLAIYRPRPREYESKEAACQLRRQLPLFGETPKRSKAKATTKYLRNCLPRILSTIHRNQAVSAQIATEHGISTKPYAQPSPIFTPKSIGKFRMASA